MAILRPLLAATGAPKMGKMVIGAVGRLRDIGKAWCASMMKARASKSSTSAPTAVDAVSRGDREDAGGPDGMSALLTTTMPYMKVVIDTLKEKGIRDDHIVLVGGAPLDECFAEAIGADAYCRDAAVAVETARALLARRQGTARRKRAGGRGVTRERSRPRPLPRGKGGRGSSPELASPARP